MCFTAPSYQRSEGRKGVTKKFADILLYRILQSNLWKYHFKSVAFFLCLPKLTPVLMQDAFLDLIEAWCFYKKRTHSYPHQKDAMDYVKHHNTWFSCQFVDRANIWLLIIPFLLTLTQQRFYSDMTMLNRLHLYPAKAFPPKRSTAFNGVLVLGTPHHHTKPSFTSWPCRI